MLPSSMRCVILQLQQPPAGRLQFRTHIHVVSTPPVLFGGPNEHPPPLSLLPLLPPTQVLEGLLREARDVPAELLATVSGGAPIPATYESVYRGDLVAHDLTGMT